jgi:hypothetical protein
MSAVTRDRLHDLVDALPEGEFATAARVLEALGSPRDYTTVTAPIDDEPETEEERLAVEEARADVAAGRVSSAAEVFRRLGL